MFIEDSSKVITAMNRFLAYVQDFDYSHTGTMRPTISFTDKRCLLGSEEDYKHTAAINGREALQVNLWNENWIGTGEIENRAKRAIGKAGNLVYVNQQTDFRNRLDRNHKKYDPNAERVLYDIYCGTNPEAAFAEAIDTFGAKYDTIAYLFFMKDYEKYLPISPGNFDRAFQSVGINFSTSFKCSWNNYCTFIGIIREIQGLMSEMLPLDTAPRLIDAHSFMWFINEERFKNWTPSDEVLAQIESRTEECLTKAAGGTPKKHSYNTVYERNAQVVKQTRKRAGGVCQLCKQAAPFTDKNGDPYLEVHHVIWLSRGGVDDICNTVALCPNCHAKMHIVDDAADFQSLLAIAQSNR